MENELTPKQEKCCIEYLKCHNKTEAYRRAYDCSNYNEASLNVNACKFFSDAKIVLRLTELSKTASLRNDNTLDRIIQEYMKIAYTDLPGIIKFNKGCMSIEDFDNLDKNQRACIKSFKIKKAYQMGGEGKPEPVEHVEVTLHDKQHALDMLAKYEATPAGRIEISGPNGKPLNPPQLIVKPPSLDE
jgi:hypothetical protein